MSDQPEAPAPLPFREPRSLFVHWAIDTAVVFLATIILLWLIVGVPWQAVVVGSAVAGSIAAPYTRRAEQRALERRRRRAGEDQAG